MGLPVFTPEKAPICLPSNGYKVSNEWLGFFQLLAPAAFNEGVVLASVSSPANDLPNQDADLLRFQNTGELIVTGLVSPPAAGIPVTFVAVGTDPVILRNEDANSLAVNRFITGVDGEIRLVPPAGRAELIYDGTSERWRVVQHTQGAWITTPYTSADYTGGWGVDPADVVTFAYLLKARSLTVAFHWQTTDVTGAPTTISVVLPGAFRAAKQIGSVFSLNDNGTFRLGYAQVLVASTTIDFERDDGVALAASAGLTELRGQLTVEVR